MALLSEKRDYLHGLADYSDFADQIRECNMGEDSFSGYSAFHSVTYGLGYRRFRGEIRFASHLDTAWHKSCVGKVSYWHKPSVTGCSRRFRTIRVVLPVVPQRSAEYLTRV